ncbi:GNAT family N-acetyltransferase [Hanstruepera neustonica]|uniref:GNAT family N-acetyltransferase n=1 Tax=Hanstruepera neustonica TaxID=1445657 RepID=A0A2K1E5A2_9FLAO|nr:GNAT family N-acetyltransferase [Hanstruepera neustonica]
MIKFKIFDTSDKLPNDWDSLGPHDIYLQRNYLQALEKASPNNISSYYIGFYNDDVLIGIALVQRVQLYLNDIFRNHKDSCFQERFKNVISRILKGNILVVGNITHTGQHGIYFDTQKMPYDTFLKCLFEALNDLKTHIRSKHGKKIRAVLMKDYFLNETIHDYSTVLSNFGLTKVSVQPNMIMDVRSHWKTFDEYIGNLHKKYRDRYKTARKKSRQIIKRELDINAIQEQSKSMYELYKNVSDNARINTFILPQDHFLIYKKQLGDQFKVYGYYFKNELIGFYSLILNQPYLETYFLGYDTAYQYKNQLYLNMLYDMAQYGIENKFKHIVYARTAMEIKSSIGAKPLKMVMYLKHTNWLLNTLLKYIFQFMNPSTEWQERHPFK